MNLLYRYSKQYWPLFFVALLLAATNQIFSLLDPLIFRHVIDSYLYSILHGISEWWPDSAECVLSRGDH